MSTHDQIHQCLRTQVIARPSLIDRVPCFEIDPTTLPQTAPELPDSLMLGKRAERFFTEWIRDSAEYELIAENIQIIEGKITVGELDCIVKRIADNQLIHVELVYKFYLYDPHADGTEIDKWIGPNRADQLRFKLNKLANRQFPLLYSAAGRRTLTELNLDVDAIEQGIFFLANLFVPKYHHVEFETINSAAVEGKWMRLNEWIENHETAFTYALAPKSNWFLRELNHDEWKSVEEMHTLIAAEHRQKRSPLVWTKNEQGVQTRTFVVWW